MATKEAMFASSSTTRMRWRTVSTMVSSNGDRALGCASAEVKAAPDMRPGALAPAVDGVPAAAALQAEPAGDHGARVDAAPDLQAAERDLPGAVDDREADVAAGAREGDRVDPL